MKLSFRPEAREEYRDATKYYLAIDPGLGRAFVSEIQTTLANIQSRPFLRPVLTSGIRRDLVPRFSFGIYYICRKNEISIHAIMHLSRNPARWKKR